MAKDIGANTILILWSFGADRVTQVKLTLLAEAVVVRCGPDSHIHIQDTQLKHQ